MSAPDVELGGGQKLQLRAALHQPEAQPKLAESVTGDGLPF